MKTDSIDLRLGSHVAEDGELTVKLEVGDTMVLLDLDQTLGLFNALGSCLDEAGLWDEYEEDDDILEGMPTCTIQ